MFLFQDQKCIISLLRYSPINSHSFHPRLYIFTFARTSNILIILNDNCMSIDPNVGVISVPDSRLDTLVKLVNPRSVVPTSVEIVDIAGLVKSGAHAAISGSIDELIGPPKDHCSAAVQNASGCSCR